MSILVMWLVSALTFLAVSEIVPGIHIESFVTALILAFLWGIIGITVKPILLILTLPINLLTFGLFTFVLNGFLFWLLGGVVKGFEIESFWIAMLGALVLSIIGGLVNWALQKSRAAMA